MASEILKRDENHVTVGAAITNDSSQDVTMLRVDPSTNYLLIDINATPSVDQTGGQVAKRDGNYRPVCLAWDEENQVLQEVLTDTDGNILMDIDFI